MEDPRPAELAHLDGRRGRHDAVGGRRHDRQVEVERVDLPGDVDVLRVPGAAAGHDRDVVEAVRAASRLADADLDVRHAGPSVPERGSRRILQVGHPEEVRAQIDQPATRGRRGPPTGRSGRTRRGGGARRGPGTPRPPCDRTPGRSRGRTCRTAAAPGPPRCGPGAAARCGPPRRTRSRSRRSVARRLAASPKGSVWKSTTGGAAERPGRGHRIAHERARVGPEPRGVEGRDVPPPLSLGVARSAARPSGSVPWRTK